MKLLQLVCVVAAALAATANALDAGPATGGTNSMNPNNRSPRTESAAADGGPMSGTSMSTNPNGGRPTTSTDAGPATAADGGPPMSGGDLSTNPASRTRTPTPAPAPGPSPTAPPALTTAAPTTPAPVTTTKAPATATEKPPATITVKPPATITEKPSTTAPAPLAKSNDTTEVGHESSTPHDSALDFGVIDGDGKDVVGEVSADAREDLVHVVPSKDATANTPSDSETANDADAPTSQTPQAQAATPSPVSKKTIKNESGVSSAPHSVQVSALGVVVTVTTVVATLAF